MGALVAGKWHTGGISLLLKCVVARTQAALQFNCQFFFKADERHAGVPRAVAAHDSIIMPPLLSYTVVLYACAHIWCTHAQFIHSCSLPLVVRV